MSSENGTESSSDPVLTQDLEAFVKECEAEFGDRYTDKDADYEKLREASIGDPPIIEPWYSKPRRNFDWSNRDRARGDNRKEDSRPRDSYGTSGHHYQNNRRDNFHNNKFRSHHDYRSRPY